MIRMAPLLRPLLAGLVLAAGWRVAARPSGPVPPLGPLLDPSHGIWATGHNIEPRPGELERIAGLTTPVRIEYDRRRVPHIFAANEGDLWRALGYVVARDRLFQLELQARATAGRLTEWVGPVALATDRATRRLDLAGAAERQFAALDSTSAEARSTRAFADGVNAWIDGLDARRLPFEYHLLGVRPERWQPKYAAYLLLQMSRTLSYQTDDLRRLRLAALVGPAAAAALMPRHSPIVVPVAPRIGVTSRDDFAPIPPPRPADPATAAAGTLAAELLAQLPSPMSSEPDDLVGSNGWAVSGHRSSTGYPMLAGDPHLDLSLPSIWYEVHLVVANDLDVYGVTFPGTPGVIIGFNRDVAWSFTNSGADVLDFYREVVDRPDVPRHTLLDGTWRPVTTRVERYQDRMGRAIAVDTFYQSWRGPLLRAGGGWLSLRWTALEAPSPIGAFHDASKAKNVDAWLDAMRAFRAPIQNGLVADSASIAWRAGGRYPLRPTDDGSIIADGRTSASDWVGELPRRLQPQAHNPAAGFLASANQEPVDPELSPAYLGYNWPAPWRALRLNALLGQGDTITPQEMERMQTDPGSAWVETFRAPLLEAARTVHDGPRVAEARRAARLLSQWDGRYTPENERAVQFEITMSQLTTLAWDELDDAGQRLLTPGGAVLAELLAEPTSIWWDRRTTSVREDRDAILIEALADGLAETERRFGPADAGGWRWDRVAGLNIRHLLRVRALSSPRVFTQGGGGTLSPLPLRGSHGASWRMVVSLGPGRSARTIFPGGQSGNPLSPFYRDRLPDWSAGRLQSAYLPESPGRLPASDQIGDLTLQPTAHR